MIPKMNHNTRRHTAAAAAAATSALLIAAAITGGGRPVYAVEGEEPAHVGVRTLHTSAGQRSSAITAIQLAQQPALSLHYDLHNQLHFAQEPAASVYYADAFGGGSSADLEGKTEAEFLKERLARYESKRKEYAAKLDEYRKKSDKELPNKERTVASYERSLKSYDEYIERVRKQIPEAERRAPLQKPVDVRFQSATVQQAAEALSKASGVAIRVDTGVPESTRLTVEAKRIRLATVLEGVAEQAGLIIEPDKTTSGGLGVLLTTGSSLSISVEGPDGVNKGKIERRPARRSTPWSSQWGTPPTRRSYYITSGALEGLLEADFSALGAQATAQALERANSALSRVLTAPSVPAIAPPAPPIIVRGAQGRGADRSTTTVTANGRTFVVRGEGVSVTSPSPDTVVISEPGTNDKGEKGYFLTVYKVDKDGKMSKVSTMFHAASSKDKSDKKDGQGGGTGSGGAVVSGTVTAS